MGIPVEFSVGDSSVGIASGYGLDNPGSISGMVGFFSSPHRPDRLCGPPSSLFNGYRGFVPRERETAHSRPSSAEVENGGAMPPLPHMSSWHSA
jgi:hypothetical protein